MDYKCDGHKYLDNADKQPDCQDGSDEKFEACCSGTYSAYNESVCSKGIC